MFPENSVTSTRVYNKIRLLLVFMFLYMHENPLISNDLKEITNNSY